MESILQRQILFIRYFSFILIDLTVLNLFDEYWAKVEVNSFTISLLAAIVLQLMLQLTFKVEHGIGTHLKKKGRKVLRILSAWAILFVSKFIILWVLEYLFSDKIQFHGAHHGIFAFIVVIMTMVACEALTRYITRNVLGDNKSKTTA
ncbi:hypothetical protein KO493_14220 [Tamlana agarivorans]|uniref:Uncharacterized protein n=1 Tax=Pseudotamlana agarivorans TaxID=481183 RepID=A0ACC5UC05_9FLAO|nr:hypothetical protein [Tamlana agarivorans]MBU2951852.1 hypothetical protein [Tamlana agarivorans]